MSRSLVFLTVLFALPVVALADFIIDDFEAGGPVTQNSADSFVEYVVPEVLGGHRDIFAINDALVTLVNTPADDAIVIQGSGTPNDATVSASTSISYDGGDFIGNLNLDVTELGDRFYIRLSQDPGQPVGWSVLLVANQKGFLVTGSGGRRLDGSGYHEILFSEFTDVFPDIELTDVDKILLSLGFFGDKSTVGISEFGIIPEPSTLTLAALALLGLLAHGRRRRTT